ncbi:MAG: hypothetical protein HQM14_03110 [SAR324 cluster bacterium]|nr:hypothetical protein [SAR324 cluster bacterium]
MFFSLTFLWISEDLPDFLLTHEWNRLFYFSTLLYSLSMVWSIIYTGEMLRQFILRRHWINNFYPGMNWVISQLLGIVLFGNVAIIGAILFIANPLSYKLFFTGTVLLATFSVTPKQITLPFRRLHRFYKQQSIPSWIWWLPVLTFSFRYLTTFLPVNGTEQLHNTLPFAKYLFRGIDFNQYNLDTHFLLLGTYETFGVFIRAFLMNDFAYHIVAQQITFSLTIGGMVLLLGTVPWILRKIPGLAVCFLAWPTMLNFAPSDTIAFKPDWIGVIAAGVATAALIRQWLSPHPATQKNCMIAVVMFSSFAISSKLTALPYIMFLLPTSVLLSMQQQKKITFSHFLMPALFFLLCLPFLGKNFLWLGNPVFPGFQHMFPKLERLADTMNFNTFQINKNTQKIPELMDYLQGYLRFWRYHPEFSVPLVMFIVLLKKTLWNKPALTTLGFFCVYITFMSFFFYPGIYQRYVAFAYILLITLSVFVFLQFYQHEPVQWIRRTLIGFALLMATHSYVDANLQRALPLWWTGISPKEYRIQHDSVDHMYFELNERCTDIGRVFNYKWRNYFYANFDVVNLEDLMGWASIHKPGFYNKYNVNFLITPNAGPKYKYLMSFSDPWFIENFSVVYQFKDLLLWQRNHFNNCHTPFQKVVSDSFPVE